MNKKILFGKWVRDTRKKKKMKIIVLSAILGISGPNIGQIEIHNKNITLFTAEVLANSLGYELWQAFKEISDTST